jgi:hypothetical protein
MKLFTMVDDVDAAYNAITTHLSGRAIEEPGPKL